MAITLEISAAHPEGFPDRTVSIVRENSVALKFDSYEFEEE